MKKVEIVIGSAFGDEGKGLVTDYLSARAHETACVIRFNGGAQAGHSVQLPDGRRHVFSHFGSGSMAGLPTFLSSFFVCNPLLFLREKDELALLGFSPRVYADPLCPITTPYDMMINQIAEQTRAENRHGSVGVGFGETQARQEHEAYALCLKDLNDFDTIQEKLDGIRHEWTYKRLADLGLSDVPDLWRERFACDAIRDHFLSDIEAFLDSVSITPLSRVKTFDHLLFEGAQGLLLDQDRGWFPHVTRSNTGLKNALTLLRQLGLKKADVYYLTRAYTTRHGAGPLPHELPEQPYPQIVDPTNKPNPYQGSLRFAWFDLDLFRKTVLQDKGDAEGFSLTTHVSMSCLDQVSGKAEYISDQTLRQTSPEGLALLAAQSVGATSLLTSYGPTRETIRRSSVAHRVTELLKAADGVKNDSIAIQRHKAPVGEGGQLFVDAFA